MKIYIYIYSTFSTLKKFLQIDLPPSLSILHSNRTIHDIMDFVVILIDRGKWLLANKRKRAPRASRAKKK